MFAGRGAGFGIDCRSTFCLRSYFDLTDSWELYCLVSTKDSQLSYRATEASLAIAEDSRHIAISTSRDSTDMRIIAVLTLIFLPGAFVAVRSAMIGGSLKKSGSNGYYRRS